MISYICGKLAYKDEGIVVIETGGIGYNVAISNNTYQTLPYAGEECKIYTHMVVKEDAISLVGFSTLQEKALFEKLITVSGVGPKLALCVLSGLNYKDLILAILREETNIIGKIKGVGKKTSERIVLELRDQLTNFDDITGMTFEKTDDLPSVAIEEAIGTMMSLGLTKHDATNLIKSVASPKDTVEEIITKALKGMN